MGRGYLGDDDAVKESIVWRMSKRHQVLVRDGDVEESRFEGERRLVEGVCPKRESSEGFLGLGEFSREGAGAWLDGSRGIGETEVSDTGEFGDAGRSGGVEIGLTESGEVERARDGHDVVIGAGEDPRSPRDDNVSLMHSFS